MNRITIDNLAEYLSNGENEMVEFKATIPMHFDVIEKQISAFANTKGGSIIFGYDEFKKTIVGVRNDQIDRLKEKINLAKYKSNCNVYTIQIENKTVAILEVRKATRDVYIKGVAYTRTKDKVFSKVGNVRSRHLKSFIEEIQFHNRNPRNTKALELLDDVSTNPERTIESGSKVFRCRIIDNVTMIGKEKDFWGFGKKESFVPPKSVTRDMRANYRYIPYLYCANNPYTALVEVRPRLGANVSVATIEVRENLSLLDFTLKTMPSKMSDAKLNLFSDLSMLFSKPITSADDVLDYIPTQYVAEYAKNLGYDGIVFRSSLTPELDDQAQEEDRGLDRYNLVIFNYEKCIPIRSNVVCVTRNYLECEQVDEDVVQIEVHLPLLDMKF